MKRILIIDDDPGVQEAFKLIFSPDQFEVSIHHNGNAIMNAAYPVPHIYILDKQLSGVDGLDLCRIIKRQAETKRIPVIMLSASPNIHVLGRLAGADDTLEKPFSIKVLRWMVDRLLESSAPA